MLVLADKTGWSESFILDDLPLARGLQYIQGILSSSRVKTKWDMDSQKNSEALNDYFDSMVKLYGSNGNKGTSSV